MIRKLLWALVFVGYAVLVWHGVTGETGPIGWLNAVQQSHGGSYSRKISMTLLTFGVTILASPLLIWLGLAEQQAKAAAAAPGGPAAARPLSRWTTGALAWFVPVALAWVGVLGYYAWDWHVRLQDSAADYPVVAFPASIEAPLHAGDHVSIPGRFLWDHAIDRREQGRTQAETTFVPMVGDAWHDGEPVRYVAQLAPADVYAWRRPASAGQGPIPVRVDGAVPLAAFDVFAKAGAPLASGVVLVVPVPRASAESPPPSFATDSALLLGAVLTGVWTVMVATFLLAMAKADWSERRRVAAAAKSRGTPATATGPSSARS